MQSNVKVVLRNPLQHKDQIDYTIEAFDSELSTDWLTALTQLLQSNKLLEKNFCFLGFPHTQRTVGFLCAELNSHVKNINNNLIGYNIDLYFTEENVVSADEFGDGPNHQIFNTLHNHFEILQGTVSNISSWYQTASYDVKYSIRQLNNLCHELESLILSRRKLLRAPEWVRPSQITTWVNATRYALKDEHRKLFPINGYDRVLGGVYMHWTQIGKTLFEVFRDENAPQLTETTCQAITHLQYYSGEFDIDWGTDIIYSGKFPWHTKEQDNFKQWLTANDLDPTDTKLSLGYLPLGQVELQESFGTVNAKEIADILSTRLDIYQIEVNGIAKTFDYCWSDANYKEEQIKMLKPGYDYQMKRASYV